MYRATVRKLQVGCFGFVVFVHCAAPPARGADVLFYGLGKGANFQQTGATTSIADAIDPWEATAFVFLNPTGAVRRRLHRAIQQSHSKSDGSWWRPFHF